MKAEVLMTAFWGRLKTPFRESLSRNANRVSNWIACLIFFVVLLVGFELLQTVTAPFERRLTTVTTIDYLPPKFTFVSAFLNAEGGYNSENRYHPGTIAVPQIEVTDLQFRQMLEEDDEVYLDVEHGGETRFNYWAYNTQEPLVRHMYFEIPSPEYGIWGIYRSDSAQLEGNALVLTRGYAHHIGSAALVLFGSLGLAVILAIIYLLHFDEVVVSSLRMQYYRR